MPPDQLNLLGWERATANYAENPVTLAILGICKFGARIGYHGFRISPTIHPNLPTAHAEHHLVMADITGGLSRKRLKIYPHYQSLPTNYTVSPLGLIDKSYESKRRIHLLSYTLSGATSTNCGIPEPYRTIASSTVNEAIPAIQQYAGGCILMKV